MLYENQHSANSNRNKVNIIAHKCFFPITPSKPLPQYPQQTTIISGEIEQYTILCALNGFSIPANSFY